MKWNTTYIWFLKNLRESAERKYREKVGDKENKKKKIE